MRRTAKKLGKERTLKLIEQSKKKDQFFHELLCEAEKAFTAQEIDIFIHRRSNSSKNRHSQQSSILESNKNVEEDDCSESNVSVKIGTDNEIKNIDLNLFNTFKKSKMEGVCDGKREDKGMGKAVLRVQKIQREKVSKNVFQVEKKMKDHYERVKHRIKFNGVHDSYQNSCSLRPSTTYMRHQKSNRSNRTNRTNRYQTQSFENGVSGSSSVPKMLMADFPYRDTGLVSDLLTSESGRYLGRGSQQQERRWNCLSRQVTTGWRRRYKCKH